MNVRPARAEDRATITAMVRGARLNPMDLQWSRFLVAEDETGIMALDKSDHTLEHPSWRAWSCARIGVGQEWADNSSAHFLYGRKE